MIEQSLRRLKKEADKELQAAKTTEQQLIIQLKYQIDQMKLKRLLVIGIERLN